MKWRITAAGLLVALFAWFNPLGLDMLVCVALFILGFDMMAMEAKLALFTINFFFPVFGTTFENFSWTLLLMVMSELVVYAIEVEKPYKLAIKPFAVFAASYIAIGLQPALVIAGIDLLINLTTKIKRSKR